jgi:hypothetical protein
LTIADCHTSEQVFRFFSEVLTSSSL